MEDLSIRLAESGEDDILIERFEMNFGVPCYITQAQQRQLYELFRDIIDCPVNQLRDGCHWLSECGSKPNWSRQDAAFLGVKAADNAPADGEPTFDDSVLAFGSCARGFVSEKERERKLKSRAR